MCNAFYGHESRFQMLGNTLVTKLPQKFNFVCINTVYFLKVSTYLSKSCVHIISLLHIYTLLLLSPTSNPYSSIISIYANEQGTHQSELRKLTLFFICEFRKQTQWLSIGHHLLKEPLYLETTLVLIYDAKKGKKKTGTS